MAGRGNKKRPGKEIIGEVQPGTQAGGNLPEYSDIPGQAKEGNRNTEPASPSGYSWRAEVEDHLKWLHAAMFGVELALEKEEWEKALGLGLRLIGFMNSRCETATDIDYIGPILNDVYLKTSIARQEILYDIESRALAKSGPTVFDGHGAVNVARIKNSALYQFFLTHDAVKTKGEKSTKKVACSSQGVTGLLSSQSNISSQARVCEGANADVPGFPSSRGGLRIPSSGETHRSVFQSYQQVSRPPLGKSARVDTQMGDAPSVWRDASSQVIMREGPITAGGDEQMDYIPSGLCNTSSQVTQCQVSTVDMSTLISSRGGGKVLNGGEMMKGGQRSHQQDLRYSDSRVDASDDQMEDAPSQSQDTVRTPSLCGPQKSRPLIARNSRINQINDAPSVIGGESNRDEEMKKRIFRSNQQDLRPMISRNGVDNEADDTLKSSGFITAKQKWATDTLQKCSGPSGTSTSTASSQQTYQAGANPASTNYGNLGKKLYAPRRPPRGNFVPPVRSNGVIAGAVGVMARSSGVTDTSSGESFRKCMELLAGPDGELPDKLRNLEPCLLEHISNEIMEQDSNVRWDDIAGLDHAKKSVTEMVIWPLLRPDIFQGCRAPGKGLLLFGPPGTGKTMIGKAIAGEAQATFFSISASSLTSKWIGEGEKLVRALFGVASCRQPAVIFVDEIDSLLSQRKADGEHESSRRMKTQFLIEMEGVGSGNEQLLLIGATNRPQELDEAARRRFSKRLYIPLPSAEARAWIVRDLLQKDGLLSLSDEDIDTICASTKGYSGSDMKNLVKEASMGPLREALVQCKDISKISKEEMRSITLQDFLSALEQIRPSVSQSELGAYEDWNHQFGSRLL